MDELVHKNRMVIAEIKNFKTDSLNIQKEKKTQQIKEASFFEKRIMSIRSAVGLGIDEDEETDDDTCWD